MVPEAQWRQTGGASIQGKSGHRLGTDPAGPRGSRAHLPWGKGQVPANRHSDFRVRAEERRKVPIVPEFRDGAPLIEVAWSP